MADQPHHTTTAARECEAWRLRARGWSQVRIGDHLGLTQSGVSKLLGRVERRELKRLSEEWEGKKAVQNAQLEHVVEEAFDAWHRSKQPRKRAASKRSSGGEGEGEGDEVTTTEVTTTEVVERDGDTGYLYCGMQALAQIRSLWGLDVAPAAQDAATSVANMTRELFARGQSYEQGDRAADGQGGDTGGAPRAPEGGAPEVPGGSGPIQ